MRRKPKSNLFVLSVHRTEDIRASTRRNQIKTLDNAKHDAIHCLTMRSTRSLSIMLKTNHDPKKSASLVRQNTKHAKLFWSGELEQSNLTALKKLTRESGLSIASGEVLWLNHGWYVTSAGLLRVAKENGCDGIQARVVSTLSDAKTSRWVFKATLKEASRELVESFISHLATTAKENRDGLVFKLNSYAQPVEVKL